MNIHSVIYHNTKNFRGVNLSITPTAIALLETQFYHFAAKHRKAVGLMALFKKKFHARSLGTDPFIRGRSGGKLTRQGVTHIVRKYGDKVSQSDPAFPDSIHCHMLRHSKAMHMLQAGINIVVIRDFLGHEDISTTMVYARADNRTKEEAIGKLAPQLLKDCPQEDPIEDGVLIKFLDNLKQMTCKVDGS